MKFKLRHLVAVIGLAMAASAQATILPGSTPTTGGELFLSVWEQGAPGGQPDESFTFDTGITFAQFLAGDSVSSVLATLSTSDPVWTSFLNGADVNSLQWAVIGSKVASTFPVSIIGTVQNGAESQVAMTTAPNIVSANVQLNTFLQTINTTGTHFTQANGESVNLVGSNAYFQGLDLKDFNTKAWNNSNVLGATAEVTQATRNTTTGFVDELIAPGTMTFANVAGTGYVLSYNVAAVPEPSGFGMALAGAFGIAFVSLRRRKS